jgi:hypothetical protein
MMNPRTQRSIVIGLVVLVGLALVVTMAVTPG